MRIFFGVFIVLIGIFLLFGTVTNDLWWNVLNNFFSVWPIIFVFIGLSVLSKISGLKWLRIVNSVLIILFVVFLFFFPGFSGKNTNLIETQVNVALEAGIEKVSIEVKIDNINLIIRPARKESQNSITGSIMATEADEIQIIQSSGRLRIISNEHKNAFFFFAPKDRIVELFLPENIYYDLYAAGGIITSRITLRKNIIEEIDFEGGIIDLDFETELIEKPFEIISNSGISKIKLTIPKTSTSNTSLEGGIKNFSAEVYLIKQSLDPQVYIEVNSGIMNIDLKTLR